MKKPFVTTVVLARKGFLGDGMDKPAQNIQDSFLNNARRDKIVLTIYLMSGVKLSGRIKSFDKYSLVLETNNQEQLIFKHAISTVVTLKASHSYVSSPPSAVVHNVIRRQRTAASGCRATIPRRHKVTNGRNTGARHPGRVGLEDGPARSVISIAPLRG